MSFSGQVNRMSPFPEEVLTRARKRARSRSAPSSIAADYVRYNYLHPETGEPMEGGKVKIVLLSDAGRSEEYFIIPTRSKRDLLVPAADRGARKIWDSEKAIGF